MSNIFWNHYSVFYRLCRAYGCVKHATLGVIAFISSLVMSRWALILEVKLYVNHFENPKTNSLTLHQEFVRVPFADFNALKLPAGTEHEEDFALLADIFPTVRFSFSKSMSMIDGSFRDGMAYSYLLVSLFSSSSKYDRILVSMLRASAQANPWRSLELVL